MKNNACLFITLSMAAALAAGCASPGMNPQGIQDNAESSRLTVDNVTHAIAPGDRLSDIALKYTGQIGQWEAIAAYNNITDPRTLRIGDTLTIPANLIPARKKQPTESVTTSANRAALNSDQSGVVAATTGTLALQRTLEVRESQSKAGDVLIAPVTTNRTFDLSPIKQPGLDTAHHLGSSAPQIRVIGSYYPKGVYQQPASYSKLLMRVAPGTIFELDQEVNEWYKIVTDQGIGYIRMVDGKLNSD